MLSPGYGGGTANIEYQALTGLSMANYSPTLSIAYQQLVPSLKWAPTINQAWNAANGSKKASIALHAFNRNMYFRDLNYKKFQFSQFFATDGKPQLTGLHAIDSAWYVSDESFYSEVLKKSRTPTRTDSIKSSPCKTTCHTKTSTKTTNSKKWMHRIFQRMKN